jgi:carboxylate-amine ligase
LAALFRCLVRRLFVDGTAGIPMNHLVTPIVAENMWRACRESIECTIIDVSRRAARPFTDWLDGLIQWLADDAVALGVEAELESLRAIPARGTSAHHQRSVYEGARQRGKSSIGATRDVVQWLKSATAGELLFGSAGGVIAGPGARLLEKA